MRFFPSGPEPYINVSEWGTVIRKTGVSSYCTIYILCNGLRFGWNILGILSSMTDKLLRPSTSLRQGPHLLSEKEHTYTQTYKSSSHLSEAKRMVPTVPAYHCGGPLIGGQDLVQK